MDLENLRPKVKKRIIDLVSNCGIDVSDWAIFKLGEDKSKASANPKYCYDWSYQNNEVIVCNLWFKNFKEDNDIIYQDINLKKVSLSKTTGARIKRALKMDTSLVYAYKNNTPLHIVICDGENGRVKKRDLDSELWHVEQYDMLSGDCRVTRGFNKAEKFIDQFDIQETSSADVEYKETLSHVYTRSAKIRSIVLNRANGICEFCGVQGFKCSNGSIYLETHHIVPLSDKGSDSVDNVIALCPNDHKKAHFSIIKETIRNEMINIIRKKI